MRKFVILMMMFVCVGISAQQKKQVVRKSAANNAEEHMTFLGVPINGKYESVKAKLRAKGLRNIKNLEEYMFGNIYGNNTTVSIEKDDNGNVYSIFSSIEFETNDINIAQPVYDKICRKIEQTYNCKKFDCEYHEMHRGNTKDRIYCVYSQNNNKKIGEIHIGYYSWCLYDISITYHDLKNEIKIGKLNNFIVDGNEEVLGTLTGIENCSKVTVCKKANSDALYLNIFPTDNNGKVIKYILFDTDKTYFNNYLNTYKSKVSYYFLNWLLNYTKDTSCIHVFHNTFTDRIECYYEEIEEERQKQLAKQQKQRRSFGFMDLMHMLAPGFFTQDDVELWNKLPESDQKAVINGTFGAYFGMGDTRGHTEKMHTPSLRNQ